MFASVEIETDASILTSGDYERFFIYNRKRYHHVIDPRTGYPIRKRFCATVIHRSAAIGDATATALLVAGLEFDFAVHLTSASYVFTADGSQATVISRLACRTALRSRSSEKVRVLME
ncbi:MAG: FAD:protein FMN transferase [Pseudomonadota bacterium]|nr:FAD:protein FMN transferase [Pseudomonadota bacterium]